jgi:hypothetical protein
VNRFLCDKSLKKGLLAVCQKPFLVFENIGDDAKTLMIEIGRIN